MLRKFLLLAAAAMLMAGCYSVSPVGNDGAASGEGLFYALPRTQGLKNSMKPFQMKLHYLKERNLIYLSWIIEHVN